MFCTFNMFKAGLQRTAIINHIVIFIGESADFFFWINFFSGKRPDRISPDIFSCLVLVDQQSLTPKYSLRVRKNKGYILEARNSKFHILLYT